MNSRRAVIAAMLALAAMLLPTSSAGASSAPPGKCPTGDGRNGVIYVDCALIQDPGSSTSPQPIAEVDSGPRICRFGAREIPCTSYAGTWDGTCYAMAADPQPAREEPIWEGRSDGVIIACTPFPCLVTTGSFIPDCPTRTDYWSPAAPVVVVDEADIARRALAQLDLDPITLGMAPKPNLADPNVLIGAPAYFWAEGGPPAIGPLSTTVTEQGITITLNATMDTVTYDTGDGATLTCTRDQVATAPTNMTLQGTPDCGHRWESSGTYTLTATSNWTITWQGPTQNGTVDYTLDNAIDVAVTDRPVNLTTNKDY